MQRCFIPMFTRFPEQCKAYRQRSRPTKKWGDTVYTNAENYVEAQAVSDKNIVTANGVGHLEFTREMLLLLEANTPENIASWYDFYKNGFVK